MLCEIFCKMYGIDKTIGVVLICVAEILKIHYQNPCISASGQQASNSMFTIFRTQVLGLGVNNLVNVAAYPTILSCSSEL